MKLFSQDISASGRSVLLIVKALGLSVEVAGVENESSRETPPISYHHAHPTLEDNSTTINGSQAIALHLIGNYDKNNVFLPADPQIRDLILERLKFDSDILSPRLQNLIDPMLLDGIMDVSATQLSSVHEAYHTLEEFLKDGFLTGSTLTLADLYCVATISTFTLIVPISSRKYPKLFSWYQKMKQLPYYKEANEIGLNKLDNLLEDTLRRKRLL